MDCTQRHGLCLAGGIDKLTRRMYDLTEAGRTRHVPTRAQLANKNILLIEPGYTNKYPPLGLMKLAAYHGDGPDGKHDNVVFVKGLNEDVLRKTWDRVYVTTLFSFEYSKIAEAIDFALRAARGLPRIVFVGGIAASLMPDRFEAEKRWSGVRFIRGLLKDSPATSLRLEEYDGDLYADDQQGTPIEDRVPDYSILDQIDYRYPVRDAYFVYASRGCIRSCSFCGVPKLEGALKDTESITGIVKEIERLYGSKKDLILMDNNIVASPKFKNVIDEIVDLGFTPDAMLERNGRKYKRRVDWNQGVDARILCKDPMYLRELARVATRPLRIAFDHWGTREPYEKSVRYAHNAGLDDLSNYMLYNFHDNAADLYRRMYLNVQLNEELGIRIYSFPMRYQPTNLPDRSHVGEKWTKYQLRSMQLILQATQGVVSGEPTFFRRAFGESEERFESLLRRPHHMIFNREYYDNGPGASELDEYRHAYDRLSEMQKRELIDFCSTTMPSKYRSVANEALDQQTRRVLEFYYHPAKTDERALWKNREAAIPFGGLAEDELVEDAGIAYDDNEDAPVAEHELILT